MDFFSSTAGYRTFTLAARPLSISAYRRRVTKRQLFALDTEKFDPRSHRVTNTEQGRIVKISRHAEGGKTRCSFISMGKGGGGAVAFLQPLPPPPSFYRRCWKCARGKNILTRADAYRVISFSFEIHAFNLSNVEINQVVNLNLIESWSTLTFSIICLQNVRINWKGSSLKVFKFLSKFHQVFARQVEEPRERIDWSIQKNEEKQVEIPSSLFSFSIKKLLRRLWSRRKAKQSFA